MVTFQNRSEKWLKLKQIMTSFRHNSIQAVKTHISYSTIYPNSCNLGQRRQAGLRPHQECRLAIGPLTLGQTNPKSPCFACCCRCQSLILLKPTHILNSRPHCTALSCSTALYPTPPYILTLVTWIQHTPLARPILTHPASLAAGGYVWPFGPNKSLNLLRCASLVVHILLAIWGL